MKYDYVFVVLVYRNTKDLLDFFSSFSIPCSKVVVVNSFYDNESECQFKEIADKNGAAFISVENKGYGYGNNKGCEYVMNNYSFDYLIISNADIEIKQMDIDSFKQRYASNVIVAPDIVNKRGIKQNPNIPFRESALEMKIRFLAYKHDCSFVLLCVNAFSRIKKIVYMTLFSRVKRTIYSAHGAFFIISRTALEQLFPLFNENMFLFNEERYLAKRAYDKRIRTYYDRSIKVFHKEDGSVSLLEQKIFHLLKQSYIVFYETTK